MRRNSNRFSNYIEITAKFDSEGACGHPIKRGQVIGYNRTHGTRCESCWKTWKAENAEAEMYERALPDYGW